jgi:hypothetical protein
MAKARYRNDPGRKSPPIAIPKGHWENCVKFIGNRVKILLVIFD